MLVNEVINAKDLPVMEFDGIIVGGGGAGMRASLQLAESGLNTAVISKVFPTTSALDDEEIKQISIIFKIFFTKILVMFN